MWVPPSSNHMFLEISTHPYLSVSGTCRTVSNYSKDLTKFKFPYLYTSICLHSEPPYPRPTLVGFSHKILTIPGQSFKVPPAALRIYDKWNE